MPDDSEKLVSLSDSSSPVTQEMGLNDALWDSANGAKNTPQLLSSEFDYGHESAASSPSSSVATNADMKLELNATDSTETAAMSSWMIGQFGPAAGSRVPFTKREKEFLCCLIQKHVYLKIGQAQSNLPTLGAFSQKNTLSSFCRVPNAAWKAIANEYNSKDNVRQRSIKQLRKCWENLKHRGNIDPAALYSGKKLQGKTSLSGAFTLTAEGGENGGITIPPPKVSEGFIETSMEDDDVTGIENAANLSSPARDVLPTDLSMRSRRTAESSTMVIDNGRFQTSYDSPSSHHIITEEGMLQSSNPSSALLLASTSSPPIISSRATFTVARADDPIITNIRTVRSLKPNWSQPLRRKLGSDILKDRSGNTRPFANYSMISKANSQKIQEMKLKLLTARIKEHDANIQRVRMQMDHAQAQHDVHMRLLRTKAAWYDAHLRKLEKQLNSGDITLVGEDEEDYHSNNPDDINIQYEHSFEEYA